MDKETWVSGFLEHLAMLGTEASAVRLASLAETSYDMFGGMDPAKVAQIEHALWPSDDSEFPETEH
jgi:hypothetical protein